MPEARSWILALLLLPVFAAAQPISFYTHSTGEQVQPEGDSLRGKPQGGRRAFQVEVVRSLMRTMKQPEAIQVVPYARGYKLLQEERRVAFFNVVRTAERESSFRWIGPLQVETDYFFESSARAPGLRSVEQARRGSVCVLRGSAYDQKLSTEGYAGLVRTSSYESCLRMLVAGRVESMPVSDANMVDLLEGLGMSATAVRRTPVVAGTTPGYIAFSRDLSEADWQRWNQAFEALRRSPQWLQMQERFLNPGRS